MAEKISSWHIKVAAEAYAAALFAQCGIDVSVQYGADQPGYDLIIAKNEKMLKVSVKGSQDGSWGLTQSYLKDAKYHAAVDEWVNKHDKNIIFCLVQFKNVHFGEMPRVYLATPIEIANRLKATAKGRGDSILYESHQWGPRAIGAGTTERIPLEWQFSRARIEQLFDIL